MPIFNQKGNNQAWIPLAMTLMLGIGFLTGLKTSKQSSDPLIAVSNNKSKASFKVDEVLGFISQKYVDEVDVNRLAEAAIQLVVDSLDPHSHYLDAETVALYRDKMEGHYVGFGIEFKLIRDTIVVSEVLDHSPAQTMGMKRGDQILVVDSDTLSGQSLTAHQIYLDLKGKEGSSAEIMVRRCEGNQDTIALKRKIIPTKSVTLAEAIDDETVYVIIESFNANTSKEFLDILEPYHEEGKLKNLVLDLRGNPGGYLKEAVKILNQFFDKKGQLLVYTEGVNSKKIEYKTAGRPYLEVDQLYILIDEESASASEIVAGAIQDLDRGTIVGRRSFGKGLVQEQYDLSSGANLKLTIAKYYTPSGRLIQKTFDSKSRGEYQDEFVNRANSGEWLEASRIPQRDSTVFLSTNGKKLYGSRGIVPDIFIPMDSILLDEKVYELYQIKEEISFDLYRHMICNEKELPYLEERLEREDWRDFVSAQTVVDYHEKLTALASSEASLFKKSLIEAIHQFDGGKTAAKRQKLKSDRAIFAIQADMISIANSNKSLTTSNIRTER